MSDMRNGRLPENGVIAAGRAAIPVGSAVLVAVSVVVVLANPPDPNIILFSGGLRAGIFGLAMLPLVPLIIAVQFGLGFVFSRMCGADDKAHEPWLLWLSGSALMSLAGVAVALAGGINPWVCGALFVLGVAYAFGPARVPLSNAWGQVLIWLRLQDVSDQRPAFGIARIGIVVGLVLIGLRAATGELNDTDFVQFYWGWLNEVRHLGGIWLSPEQPLIFDYIIGRGNGIYLLFAGLAPGLVIHAVSAVFCVLFAVILRAFVLRATDAFDLRSETLALLAADLAALAALWMLPGSVSFGKYHLEFAAWALGLLLAAQMVALDDGPSMRSRRLLLIPLAIALPIGLAQFEAFAILVIGLVALTSNSWRGACRLIPLIVIGGASAGLSLLANWLYLGIPDFNPFPLFERFIIDAHFELWTSRLQQYYINYIQAGAFTFDREGAVGIRREMHTLLSGLYSNLVPILVGVAGIAFVMVLTWRLRCVWGKWLAPLLGLVLGYALFWIFLAISFSELATKPFINQLVAYAVVVVVFLLVVRRDNGRPGLHFAYALFGYWLICGGFVLLFHSGSMERLMRHADAVAAGLVLIGLVYAKDRIPRFSVPVASVVTLLVASAFLVTVYAGLRAAANDSPSHLIKSTLGLRGRAVGLANPLVKFERCGEIAASVQADARAIFLNAYTAMAPCNNSVLLPRTMIVHAHESDYARDIASSGFAGADQVEQALRRLKIDYFLVLKGDSEFWASGLSAPFRPGELERRFDLAADTPSFYILTWRGSGKAIPAAAIAAIAEWRRIAIQQHGFIWKNEFVGQWRAMANLGADRPIYELGSRLDFTSGGWSALYADHGWYAAESVGTWTLGPRAILTLPLKQPTVGSLAVSIELTPFLVPQLPTRSVRVEVDGRNVATWQFKLGDAAQVKTFELPADLVRNKSQLVFTFDIENSLSPYALNISPDWRQVGIMVRSLMMREAAGAAR